MAVGHARSHARFRSCFLAPATPVSAVVESVWTPASALASGRGAAGGGLQRRRSQSPERGQQPRPMFSGVRALLVPGGVLSARLEVWRRKVAERGGLTYSSPDNDLTHVLVADSERLASWASSLSSRKTLRGVPAVKYDWLQRCLQQGQRLPEEPFLLKPVLVDSDAAEEQEGGAAHLDKEGGRREAQGEQEGLPPAPSSRDRDEAREAAIEERAKGSLGAHEGSPNPASEPAAAPRPWDGRSAGSAGKERDARAGQGPSTQQGQLRVGADGLEVKEQAGGARGLQLAQGTAEGAGPGDAGAQGLEQAQLQCHQSRDEAQPRPASKRLKYEGPELATRAAEAPGTGTLESPGQWSAGPEGDGGGSGPPEPAPLVSPRGMPSTGTSTVSSLATPGRLEVRQAPTRLSEEEELFWWKEIFEGAAWALPEKEAAKKQHWRDGAWLEFASKERSSPSPAPGEGQSFVPSTVAQGLYCPPNLNGHITGPFSELRAIYKDGLGDEWRSFSYLKAIPVLEKVPVRVTCGDRVRGLPAIGASILRQIEEIVATGTSQRLEGLKQNELTRTVALFGSVWGIGPKVAQRLYELGHRQLSDLEQEPSLTSAQRIALRHHEDINTRIARADAAAMEALVRREAEAACPGISILCGGSYRRGKMTVGDMDFIATHPDGTSHVGFLAKLVRRLKDIDFITDDLGAGYHHNTGPSARDRVDTFFGLCVQPGRATRHRLDLKVFPLDQYPFGLLAWTGNDVLNRRLRHLADTRGFRMDDKGIVVAPGARPLGEGGGKQSQPQNFGCRTEEDVFKFFECSYLEPHRRNL